MINDDYDDRYNNNTIVSVQNARIVSSNAHPNRASTPPLDARFWPRIAPLQKTPKTTLCDAHDDSKTHNTRKKERDENDDENDDTSAR